MFKSKFDIFSLSLAFFLNIFVTDASSPDFVEQIIADAIHVGILKGKDQIVSLKVSQIACNTENIRKFLKPKFNFQFFHLLLMCFYCDSCPWKS